jgi:hypothetical protein
MVSKGNEDFLFIKKQLIPTYYKFLFSDIKNKYDLCYCFIYLIIEL